VLETGPGSYDVNGKIVPLTVKIGDRVLLPEYGGTKIKLGEEELVIYQDNDIVGKLE
jgi:chaperonin GroES